MRNVSKCQEHCVGLRVKEMNILIRSAFPKVSTTISQLKHATGSLL